MRRLVLASDNGGKLREFAALLAPLGIDVVAQGRLGIGPADEPHPTFVENALAKARHAAAGSGMPALADDSGLCCTALGGAPGVRSARFAGTHGDDAANNRALLAALADLPDRSARYVCVLAAVRSADDPEPLIAEGRWEGRIAPAPRGQGGFGYDPIFELAASGMTVAEMDPLEKNRISHRAIAMQAMRAALADRWDWR